MRPVLSSALPGAVRDAAFESGEIHVWHADLARLDEDEWHVSLPADDRARGRRFVQKRHRDRYLQGRHCLRTLLAAYTGVAPGELPLETGPHGKPTLPAGMRLGFNMSHSGDAAVFAFGRNPMLGIDIERTVPPQDVRGLAAQVFHPRELRAFAALPDAALLRPFLTCWTRKEAALKAAGTGLTVEARTVEVGLDTQRRRIAHPALPEAIDVATLFIDAQAIVSLAAGADGNGILRARHFRFSSEVSA
ncbi:4'-phosphopantetheinyl transferase superfamily protein [Oxalobacteraceae bacterium OM1]|nr:4'-phosphopantetheinyl transferase superfamily protein [Oxalobacteraceae bacterium OM1]